ncbi:MAG TPA: hypothetical protein VNT42_03340 [Sphingomonas sp.]|nr:hypothetical protein [Sphingomonas sp.]
MFFKEAKGMPGWEEGDWRDESLCRFEQSNLSNAILSNGICGFENVGGDIDKVTGKRVIFAAFPWR